MTDTLTTDQAVTQQAEQYKQWVIGSGRRGPVLAQNAFKDGSERNYNLKGLQEHGNFLQWEKQTWGINLGWTDDHSPATAARVSRWFFARPGGGTGQLKYGETIALGNGKSPSFLRYESRTFGINLGWSDGPVFEWKLLGKAAGQPVMCGDRLAIYNAKAGSDTVPGVLIAFDRTVGGDIGWPDSKTWFEQVADELVRFGKKKATELVMKKLGGA